MSTRKKRKARAIHLRFRKNDPTHNLIAATQHWIKANGGSAIVLGSIGIMCEGAFKYSVCIGAMGRPPEKEKTDANS
jgi:hypothetical protein